MTANTIYVLYDYDVRDRVTEIDHQKSTNVRIVRERLAYDDAGNIVESIVASVTTTYSLYLDRDPVKSIKRNPVRGSGMSLYVTRTATVPRRRRAA